MTTLFCRKSCNHVVRSIAIVTRTRFICSEVKDKDVKAVKQEKEKNNDKDLKFSDLKLTNKDEVERFLKKMKMSYVEGHTCLITSCLRHCRQKLKVDHLDKLFVNSTTGYFVCTDCCKSGTWTNLVENIKTLDELIDSKKRLNPCFTQQMNVQDLVSKPSNLKARDIYEQSLPIKSCDTEKLTSLLDDLGLKTLKSMTLQKYQVRVNAEYSGLVFPIFGLGNKVVAVKTMSRSNVESETGPDIQLIPKTDVCGFFGYNLLGSPTSDAVLTWNELDALAIFQETGKVAFSLGKGNSHLPLNVLPLLENIKNLTLWLGGDSKRWNNSKQLATKLNAKRCRLIRSDKDIPSAFDALKTSKNLKKILASSRALEHENIAVLQTYQDKIYDRLIGVEGGECGVQWQRYSELNKFLKGHRRGELTVLTGRTGSGKTTFLSEYSLDLCMQGVNTLWGSFEINNVTLAQTMLTQFAHVDLKENLNNFQQYCNDFNKLSMYFMTYHGQENIKKVIETMSHAVYVHDVGHVIVDNLQFMLGLEDIPDPSTDKYQRQDNVISLFRKFATVMDCHVTLVIHPRKEKESELLTISSIFGSGKASQEADNILILQTSRKSGKFIQVAKNRYDGELGDVTLNFVKKSRSYCPNASTISSQTNTEKSSNEPDFEDFNSEE